VLALLALAPGVFATGARAAADEGLVLMLDRGRYELVAHDARDGESGPRLPVTIGSPAHPTPAGEFALRQVVLHPAWTPTPRLRRKGALAEPPSDDGPMGVAKLPFAQAGAIALHGGATPLVLGKPVSNGCVRALDEDLLALLAWLDARGALGPEQPRSGGEIGRSFRRPAVLRVR